MRAAETHPHDRDALARADVGLPKAMQCDRAQRRKRRLRGCHGVWNPDAAIARNRKHLCMRRVFAAAGNEVTCADITNTTANALHVPPAQQPSGVSASSRAFPSRLSLPISTFARSVPLLTSDAPLGRGPSTRRAPAAGRPAREARRPSSAARAVLSGDGTITGEEPNARWRLGSGVGPRACSSILGDVSEVVSHDLRY